MNVVTRIAPSPTGYLHFGLARTALYSYLYARQNGGTYVLRIEDTDAARNKPEYEADIHEQLSWLGLAPDIRYRQSDHLARHTECLTRLIADGHAYVSEEASKDDPEKTASVVRFRNPGITIAFADLIRGEIAFDTTELGNFVIARSVDDPLYHLAVVVDDHDEGVTHVIRGEDHISNTPRHILLQRALGFQTPHYAHIPLILMPDKSKMSKRKHESAVRHFRERGILPEALINYLALLGWNPGGERELYSLEELVPLFSIGKVHKSGAVFDEEKLLWFNHQYLRRLPDEEFLRRLFTHLPDTVAIDPRLAPFLKERARTLHEASEMLLSGEFDFFGPVSCDAALLLHNKTLDATVTKAHLGMLKSLLSGMAPNQTDPERVKACIMPYADKEGRGAVLWPLRVALSGKERSLDPFTLISLVGTEEAIKRLDTAREVL